VVEGQLPAVAVALGDKPYQAAGEQHRYKGPLAVHIYVVVNSMRTTLARLAGDVVSNIDTTADPGAEVILEALEQQLIGAELNQGARIKELRPVRETFVAASPEFTLFELHYECVVTRTINPARRQSAVQLDELLTRARLADDPTGHETTTTLTENV